MRSAVPESTMMLTLARGRRTVRLGLKSLWSHRLRSLLTVLGIVFGVCSVIAMLAIGEGASYEAQEQLRQLGSNNILLKAVKPPEDTSSTAETSYVIDYGITYADVRAIKNIIPSVEILVPSRVTRADVWRFARKEDCDVIGTVPWYPRMSGHPVDMGRFFTDIEMDEAENVCVLADNLEMTLFPLDMPVGKHVRVGGDYYRVIGVMAQKDSLTPAEATVNPMAQPQSSDSNRPKMYIPLTASKMRIGEFYRRYSSGSREVTRVPLHEVTVKVARQEDVVETSQILEELLKQSHKKRDYEIVVPLTLLRQSERTKRIFNIVLGAIAAISLIVGGIGIMNIMLASVTERTREIGIRRALGARRRDIVLQFLVETVILSATGGVIGVFIGVAIPFAIQAFADMRTIVTPGSPVIAFTISALVGVVFGLYPAFRAAHMDPVEALRHE